MKVTIKNLDSSHLVNINFFEMRDIGFIPDVHAHRSDSYFDLFVDKVETVHISNDKCDLCYLLYPSNHKISPYKLVLPYGYELMILPEGAKI